MIISVKNHISVGQLLRKQVHKVTDQCDKYGKQLITCYNGQFHEILIIISAPQQASFNAILVRKIPTSGILSDTGKNYAFRQIRKLERWRDFPARHNLTLESAIS